MSKPTNFSPEVLIAGYAFGDPSVQTSPVSLEELRQLEEASGWSEADAQILQRHAEIFRANAERMVDTWRAAIGRQPHLAKWFFNPAGQPDEAYKARVKKRFVQWVVDAVTRPHDADWLNYQEEIGLRHTPAKKNQTDGAETPGVVPLRYLIGFVPVVATTTRAFFVESGVAGEELQRLEDAWLRAVQLHVALWARAYAKDGLW